MLTKSTPFSTIRNSIILEVQLFDMLLAVAQWDAESPACQACRRKNPCGEAGLYNDCTVVMYAKHKDVC